MNILAIESSCDETAAAIVKDGVEIVSNVVASSHKMHEKYGGIVPEVAARMQLESIIPVITEALGVKIQEEIPAKIQDSVDAIAVTVGPGLIGSLLVGVETAKTIAAVTGKPLISVNHVLAHMYANFIHLPVIASGAKQSIKLSERLPRPEDRSRNDMFPAISLVVSGGHTELYLMKSPRELTWLGGTLDDAAGEAFDKTARLLGFGHGGGLAIQEAAIKYRDTGSTTPIRLPRPMLEKDNELNFSFSGLKTAILREVNRLKQSDGFTEQAIQELAHEVQETITDVLVKKTFRAVDTFGVRSILLSGGVASNVRLREKFREYLDDRQTQTALYIPPVQLCTDNAVYIGSYAFFRGKETPWQDITAVPDLSVEVSA